MEERTSINTFNMATQSLIRIDNLLVKLNDYNIERNLFMISRVLFSLWKEVYPYLNTTERTKGAEYITDMRDGIISLKNNIVSFTGYFPFIIDNFELWLRDMLHRHKLLMATSDDPAQALGESG